MMTPAVMVSAASVPSIMMASAAAAHMMSTPVSVSLHLHRIVLRLQRVARGGPKPRRRRRCQRECGEHRRCNE
jgi:hypothetical protein